MACHICESLGHPEYSHPDYPNPKPGDHWHGQYNVDDPQAVYDALVPDDEVEQVMYYTEVQPHDDCTCRWINYSDGGGWYMKRRDRNCPIHGDGAGQPALVGAR